MDALQGAQMAHEYLVAMLANPDPRHLFGMVNVKPTIDELVTLAWGTVEKMDREEQQRRLSADSDGGGKAAQSDPPTGR